MASHVAIPAGVAPVDVNRRRTIRLRTDQVHVAVSGRTERLIVRDLSEGGFSIGSDTRFAPNTLETFTFTAESLRSVRLARTAYSCRQDDGGWVSGLEFVGADLENGSSIEAMLDLVISSAIALR